MARFRYPLSPYGNLMTQPIALVGGLQDSQARPDPTMFQKLQNFVHFRGRFAIRAPVTVVMQLLDDQGSPAPVTNTLGTIIYANQLWALAYSSVTQKVYLYSANLDGTNVVRQAVVC